ncbi:MAG: hypothetical protein HUJ84_05275 [Veillonella sp.]|nr:hypothetical protein [Veillonella sp.]MCF0155512.1 hypothetical protein [Veillonella sp.]
MTNKFDRKFLEDYVRQENETNHYGAPMDAMDTIIDLIQHFGIELYRPITRLLLANWNELSDRIAHYTPEQWATVEAIEASTPELSRFAIAMLMEVLEGDDTLNQHPEAGRKLTDEELAEIRASQDQMES